MNGGKFLSGGYRKLTFALITIFIFEAKGELKGKPLIGVAGVGKTVTVKTIAKGTPSPTPLPSADGDKKSRDSLLKNATRLPIPFNLALPKWVDPGDYYTRKSVFDGEEDQNGENGNGGSGSGSGSGSASSSDLNAAGGKLGAGGAGVGKPGGAGAATAGAGKGKGFGYDESLAKEKAAPNPGPPPGGETPPGNPPPGPVPPRPPDIVTHNLFWPVCMFFPPSVSTQEANAIAKKFVEMSNGCQVNIQLEAIRVQAFDEEDENAIVRNSVTSCNAVQGISVPRASTMVAVKAKFTADRMCKDQKDPIPNVGCPSSHPTFDARTNKCYGKVAGCAQLCRNGTQLDDQNIHEHDGEGHAHSFADTPIVPSIIDANGLNGWVAQHEAMGHSQMCWPNGARAGNGIGHPTERRDGLAGPGTPSVPANDWSDIGCRQMRANALPNTRRVGFNPAEQTYFKEPSPDRAHVLGQPFWRPPGNPIPPNNNVPPPPPIAIGSPPGGGAPPGQIAQNFNPPVGQPPPIPGDPGGHKKDGAAAGGGASAPAPISVSSARNGTAGSAVAAGAKPGGGMPGLSGDNPLGVANPGGPGNDLASKANAKDGGRGYGYDESATKEGAAGNNAPGSSGVVKVGAPGSSGSGSGGSTFDGSNPKGAKEGTLTSADAAKNGKTLDGRVAGGGNPLDDVKNGSSVLDDAFFKKLKPRAEDARRPRGGTLRGFGKTDKSIYGSYNGD